MSMRPDNQHEGAEQAADGTAGAGVHRALEAPPLRACALLEPGVVSLQASAHTAPYPALPSPWYLPGSTNRALSICFCVLSVLFISLEYNMLSVNKALDEIKDKPNNSFQCNVIRHNL